MKIFRKTGIQALRDADIKYRIVAENTYDWEWWRDPKGDFIYISPSCERITHHPAAEFFNDPDLLYNIIHPDDKSAFFKHHISIEQQLFSGEIEFRIVRPDGTFRWIGHACQPVFDRKGRFMGRRGSNRDITDRKRAEEKLKESQNQLRHLSSRLLTAQETERRRISRELHDDLGGALSLLKLRCSLIEKKLAIGLREECRQNLAFIDQIIDSVHRLSRDLSPSIIEDLGLMPAIRWLVDNFATHHQIKVIYDISDVGSLLAKEDHVHVYRIFQEVLTNLGKHARAKTVIVKISENDEAVSFCVEDDGVGFDMEAVSMRPISEKGLGLATMDERARMLGGSLEISSPEGKGTRMTLRIPRKKDRHG